MIKKDLSDMNIKFKIGKNGKPIPYAFEVKWNKRFIENDIEVGRVPHRKAYSFGQRESFEEELGDVAADFVDKIDWTKKYEDL